MHKAPDDHVALRNPCESVVVAAFPTDDVPHTILKRVCCLVYMFAHYTLYGVICVSVSRLHNLCAYIKSVEIACEEMLPIILGRYMCFYIS